MYGPNSQPDSSSGPLGPSVVGNREESSGEGRLRERIVFVSMERTDKYVSTYQIYSMEESFSKLGIRAELLQKNEVIKFIGKVLAKLRLMRRLATLPDKLLLVPAHFISEYKLFPYGCFHEVITYSHDCWPNKYDAYESFYRRHKIKLAFISARQSAEELQRRSPQTKVIWMPEATDPTDYCPRKKLLDRSTDVLELGRKYDRYHSAIVEFLRRSGRTHLYEIVKGQTVFPNDKKRLAAGLGDAKISVCFPGSLTHAFSGGVETATHRYFETFASKCLPVGRAPQELIDLFGYNPVIEADLDEPTKQLENTLQNIGDYQRIVDRNYERVLEVGTWDVRVKQILEHIEKIFG